MGHKLITLSHQDIEPILGSVLDLQPGVHTPLVNCVIPMHVHPEHCIPFDRLDLQPQTSLPLRPREPVRVQLLLPWVQEWEVRLAARGHVAQEHEEAGHAVAHLARVRLRGRVDVVVPVQRVVLARQRAPDLQRLEPLAGDQAGEVLGALDDARRDGVFRLGLDDDVARGAPVAVVGLLGVHRRDVREVGAAKGGKPM